MCDHLLQSNCGLNTSYDYVFLKHVSPAHCDFLTMSLQVVFLQSFMGDMRPQACLVTLRY